MALPAIEAITFAQYYRIDDVLRFEYFVSFFIRNRWFGVSDVRYRMLSRCWPDLTVISFIMFIQFPIFSLC